MLSSSISTHIAFQTIFYNHCVMMQSFPSGSWDFDNCNILLWHGALNCLPQNRGITSLKHKLTTLQNMISLLNASYQPVLNNDSGPLEPSVDEEDAGDCSILIRAQSMPPQPSRAPQSSMVPPIRPSRTQPSQSPTTPIPPACPERSNSRVITNLVVGKFENLPLVSSFYISITPS